MVATHAGVFTGMPDSSALAVDYHPDMYTLACTRVSGVVGWILRVRVVPDVFLAPSRFPGPSLAPLEAFEALWVA